MGWAWERRGGVMASCRVPAVAPHTYTYDKYAARQKTKPIQAAALEYLVLPQVLGVGHGRLLRVAEAEEVEGEDAEVRGEFLCVYGVCVCVYVCVCVGG